MNLKKRLADGYRGFRFDFQKELNNPILTMHYIVCIIYTQGECMTRLNITLPDEIAKALTKKRNKSGFIAEALKEKFLLEEREELVSLLIAGYEADSFENTKSGVDWEKIGLEKWD